MALLNTLNIADEAVRNGSRYAFSLARCRDELSPDSSSVGSAGGKYEYLCRADFIECSKEAGVGPRGYRISSWN